MISRKTGTSDKTRQTTKTGPGEREEKQMAETVKRIHYRYSGPVYIFDRLVTDSWSADTMAVSAKKAKVNLSYQYKKKYGFEYSVTAKLPGELTEVQE